MKTLQLVPKKREILERHEVRYMNKDFSVWLVDIGTGIEVTVFRRSFDLKTTVVPYKTDRGPNMIRYYVRAAVAEAWGYVQPFDL